MTFSIDWIAFVQVFVAAMIGAVLVVFFYSLGPAAARARGPGARRRRPAEFTDAITVITEKEAQRAAKAAAKAARKSPLTDGQKRVALWGAYCCFGMARLAVLGGLLLILFNH